MRLTSKLHDRFSRRFTATFTGLEPPTHQDIAAAQEQAGFHPCGYGGPSNVSRMLQADGSWRVTWECGASCD